MSDQSQPVQKKEPSNGLKVFRRFVGGTVGGVIQALCSHPFDTIKSRMQQGLEPTIGACVRSMYAKEGLPGFYRGVTPPLAVIGTYNAVLFSINQAMTLLVTPAGHKAGDPLPMWRVALAAQLTAPFSVVVLTPMEVVKVKLQVQPEGQARLYHGPFDCAKKVVKQHGARALMSGFWPTVGSRLIGLPFYFLGYETTKRYLSAGRPPKEVPAYVPPVAGSSAGIAFWCACYPFDFTKTRVQASNGTSAFTIAKETYAASGAMGFYRGFGPCMLRAVPANASVWLGMEETIKAMERAGW